MHPTPGRLEIRAARQEDFPRWKVLWDGYNAFYGREGRTALPAEVVECTWRRILDPAEPVNALVAERDGRLVGLAHFIFHRTTIAVGPTCYLQDIFTLASERGRGIGRALIEGVCDRARSTGAVRVYWQTHETNVTARKLYDRVGENTGFIVYRKVL